MGGAKREMMEAEERGWSADDKFVCDACHQHRQVLQHHEY